MGSIVACLTFIHGMRQPRISAFADKHISSILHLSVTPQSEIGTRKKEGKPVNFFKVVFRKLMVFIEPLLIVY